jgi:hypothetical protein
LEPSAVVRYQQRFRQDVFQFGFLLLPSNMQQFSAAVRGGRFSNSPTAAILNRYLPCYDTPYLQ